MDKSNEETFISIAKNYKYKYKSIIYYGIILSSFIISLILFILFLKFTLFSSKTTIKYSDIQFGRKENYLKSDINSNQCNKNLMADITRNCLITRFKKPPMYPNNENERYNQCMNSLSMNPYITKIIKEYIDMIKEDICSNPDLTNQKSTKWFNTPIETIIYDD